MSIYRRCRLVLTEDQLQIINRMYPYGVQYYGDLRKETQEFLRREFPNLPEETRIFASTEHNGRGRQWGVILLCKPGESVWQLVGHFGHRLFMGGLAGTILNPDYFRLIWLGKTDPGWLVSHAAHAPMTSHDTPSLKSFTRECEWLSRPFDPIQEMCRTFERLDSQEQVP